MLRSNRYSLNDDVIQNLKLYKKELEGPLPSDAGRFEEDFEGADCAGDFYEYFALVCGSVKPYINPFLSFIRNMRS